MNKSQIDSEVYAPTGQNLIVGKQHYCRARELKAGQVNFYFRHFGKIKKLLDLGCGTGSMGKYKPKASIEVFGLDKDPRAIKQANRYEKAQLYDLERAELPFPEAFFCAVLAKDILEHLIKPQVLVQEIFRVLKPGGTVIASVPMPKPRVVWGDYTHIRGFTKEALCTMFEDGGFKVVSIWKMGGVPLTGRLGLIRLVPWLLKLALLDYLYGSSFEIKAYKPSG